MTPGLYEVICDWQNKTFPKATPLSAVNHLQEEVQELKEQIEKGICDKSEIADCFLLLISVCNKYNLSYADIIRAIEDKMLINLKRKWGEPNEQGYQNHVK